MYQKHVLGSVLKTIRNGLDFEDFQSKVPKGVNMFIYWLVIALIVLNIIDLMQTRKILSINGHEGEANIFARYVYKSGSFTGLVIYKIILISFSIIVGLAINQPLVFYILIGVYILAVSYNFHVMVTDPNINW